jgi:hypothetical protein
VGTKREREEKQIKTGCLTGNSLEADEDEVVEMASVAE